MNGYLRKTIGLFAVFFFCASLFGMIGCASSASKKFQSKIQAMSDDDLINYYHGINDRIKDIDRDIKQDESEDRTEKERVISDMPFIFGGEGHDLIQKQKMILKELRFRNITP